MKSLEQRAEKILSGRVTAVSSLYLTGECKQHIIKRRKAFLRILKLFSAFASVFVFCFALTVADYANRDLGSFGTAGLFSFSLIGKNATLVIFDNTLSFELPKLIADAVNAVSELINRLYRF